MGNNKNDGLTKDSIPTDGVIGGNTMIVWPKTNKPSPEEIFNQITSTGFDPLTGNGWLPAVDGMQIAVPQQMRKETLASITQVKQSYASPQGNSLMSADFWVFEPAYAEPSMWNSEVPVITIVPASVMTDASLPAAGSSLPKSVGVNTRILDEVHGGKQHLAAVGTKKSLFHIPLIPVRATKYGGSTAFFCGMMPGEFNFLEFYLSFPAKGVKEQKLPWKTSVKSGKLRPAGATVGSNTHDFIACFPPGSKQAPLYIAMTCVITAEKVRQRQAAENQAATAKGTTEAKARAQAEAKAKTAAEAKARAQAEAKAKAATEAKARAQAEAKAKAAAEAIAKIEAAMPPLFWAACQVP